MSTLIMSPSALLMLQQPTIPAPDPVPVPAPGWLLWFLLMLTFVLHILAMNFVLGGSIIGAVTRWRAGSTEGSPQLALFRWLSKAMPVAVAATITLGVAPLLFVQVLYGRLFFASSVLMAWFWFAVIPLLILAYLTAYLLAFRGEQLGARELPAAWLMAALFVVIGFIYSNNMTLMLRPEAFVQIYRAGGGGTSLNLGDPTMVPRYLHMLLGAVGVAGLMIAAVGYFRRSADQAFGDWAMRYGAKWFVGVTCVNIVVGIWFLAAQPSATLMRFLGDNVVASALLILGVVLALGALLMAFASIYAPASERPLLGSAAALVLAVVMMALMRDQVRRAALDAAGFEPAAWVAPQWGVIVLFAVLLVVALAAVGWMVIALARGKGVAEAT
ncbi:MAG: hypothetical protein PVJ49_05375 [Acidobacteriota bacterium]|jgi:hypothetical protein